MTKSAGTPFFVSYLVMIFSHNFAKGVF